MIKPSKTDRPKTDRDLVAEVDALNEEVKSLALNLAIYLAKVRAKTPSAELDRLEPEFIRLVNGTVKVVQEMTVLLNAARNQETMAYEVPSGRQFEDHLSVRLQAIARQCAKIVQDLGGLE
ncbi:hypothetical protein GF420_02960 [candidate division GN15 bacterium]|nr:hypothetical protein [candidate division GN15 bacterium]